MYMESASILIVDDEPKHVRLLCEILSIAGYNVLTCSNGDKAVEKIVIEQPNLVIIDIVLLGNMDGYQLTERIRGFSDLPIVILTARNREADMLRGFDSGADEYITKPFSAQELLARIKAILGRTMTKIPNSSDTTISAGGLTIDQLRRQVTLYDREIYLTPTEYKLLLELAENKNRVLLHEQLLEAVWGVNYREDLEYLRAYIHYLRRKMEPDPGNPKLIIRVPGVGYMLEIDQTP